MGNLWLAWKEWARFAGSIADRYDDVEASMLKFLPRFAAGVERVNMIIIPQQLKYIRIDSPSGLMAGAVDVESIPGDLFYEIFRKYTAN
jgi:hypothetical protein